VKSGNEGQDAPGQYQLYIEKNTPTSKELSQIMQELDNFEYKPVISIVMPVYNVAEEYLVKAIASVKQQAYSRWELCICDDASTLPYIKPLLQKYAREDQRIRVAYRGKNGGIVKASNEALKMAQGAYVGLLDNDDELTPDALFEVVKALQERKYDLLYSDEDKLDLEGKRCEPFFKPDWAPDLLLSINYISHFGVYRRKILSETGGFRDGFDGSQDYDLVLRFTEKTGSIRHIPKILYHWRKIPGSTAENVQFKTYAIDSAKKALGDALKRRKIDGAVEDGLWTGSYRVKRVIAEQPLVSIIIPFKDKIDVLKTCLESILTRTTYQNFEIILVDNLSELYETREYLNTLIGNPKIRFLRYEKPFNYAAINNWAAGQANGEVLILLNNDTEIITPGWIEAMLEHAQRPEVGAVGAKLLYPNNTLQHAGVLIGVSGVANHAFSRHDHADHGYFGQADVIRNYSAVTAACAMVRKSVFQELGGLDEQNLAVAFNDVDFCLRLREKGYLVVYTPYAKLYHHESLSRGRDVDIKEVLYMKTKYAALIQKGDPYYNPNLTRENLDFSLRCGDKLPMP
jgi:GT2 family glycosyltransferase